MTLAVISKASVSRLVQLMRPGSPECVGTIRFNANGTFDICKFTSSKTSAGSHTIRFPLKRYATMFHTHPNACRKKVDSGCSYDPPSATDIRQMTVQNEQYGTATSVVFTVNGTYVVYFRSSKCCASCHGLPQQIQRLQKRFPPGKRYNSEFKRLFRTSKCMDLAYYATVASTAVKVSGRPNGDGQGKCD